MAQGSENPHQCRQCGAPVGTSGGRCPLCGELSAPVEPSQHASTAVVGLSERNARRSGITIASHGPSPLPKLLAAGAILTVASIGALLFVLRADDSKPSELHAPLMSAAPPSLSQPLVSIMVEGVELKDARRTDATDLLPAIQRQLGRDGATASLVDITVNAARGAIVDLTQPDAQIAYRFTTTRSDPLAAPSKSGERPGTRLVFKQGAPAEAERITLTASETPAPEPTCVWNAAFRAAVASGLPAEGPLDARYAMSSKPGTALWIFTAADGSTRSIDGHTCAIFTQ